MIPSKSKTTRNAPYSVLDADARLISSRFRNNMAKCLAAVFLLMALTGCGRDDGGRKIVFGTVTWKGEPVPNGILYFTPDTSKGSTGPQGFAQIKDGAFDTRHPLSKGCATGPHKVTIQGCDGKNIRPNRPYGDSLFVPVEIDVDIPIDGGEVNLIVPDSAQPVQTTELEEL
jgi:hypothetical protein